MTRALCLFAALGALACITPPPIIMVDRATALEQQASGSFSDLEKRLARTSVATHPIPFTPEQLEALGLSTSTLVDRTNLTDADRVDDLLERRCIGEGLDGLLADTPDACRGVVDHEGLLVLLDRVNRARAQLWHWMLEQRPNTTLDDLRKRWREAHVRGVVCGGWIQGDDGKWSSKVC